MLISCYCCTSSFQLSEECRNSSVVIIISFLHFEVHAGGLGKRGASSCSFNKGFVEKSKKRCSEEQNESGNKSC